MIHQQQSSPLFVLLGIKNHVPSLSVIASSGIFGRNLYWSAKLLRSAGNVHCVQTLMIVTASILTHGHCVNRSVWPGCGIDNGSRSNSDLRGNLGATPVIRGSLARRKRSHVPQARSAVRVQPVHCAMFTEIGVELTPMSGLTWENPGSSEVVSPAASVVTCHRLDPLSASNPYTVPCSLATNSTLCVPFPGILTLGAYKGCASTRPSVETVNNFPNVVEFTFLSVSAVSLELCPVRRLSL